MKYFVLLISLCLLTSCKSSQKMTEYMPVSRVVDRGDHKLEPDNAINTKGHRKSLVKILDKYNEDYQIIGDFERILITKSLSKDLDLLANYTKKAEQARLREVK